MPPARLVATAVLVGALAAGGCGPNGGHGDDDDDGSDAAAAIDAGGDVDGLPVPDNAAVYAHTAIALYRVDPDTLAISLVANFGGDAAGDSMTDIAIDATGEMIGISYTRVYRIDAVSAVATRVGTATLPQAFNGLSFVPHQLAYGTAGPDVLVGSRNTDGKVFEVDPLTGVATQIGDMGAFTSSGDIVAVTGFGIVATVPGTNGDLLVRLAPGTFAATPIGTGTGFSGLWGVGYWRDRIFGFASGGNFVGIDTSTGVGTLISNAGQGWWGAAVATAAPIIP